MQAYVYIMASDRNGTLYTGVTSDLRKLVGQHRTGALPGFTDRYKFYRLVYYEVRGDIVAAITAEKR